MRVTITPGRAHGTVAAPPSKSMGHRLMLCAGFADGQSTVHGISGSEDMHATLDVLSALGAVGQMDGDTVTFTGIDPRTASPVAPLPCRESGSTLRFFVPVALLSGTPVTFTGAESLFRRPLSVYEELCRAHGLLFEKRDSALTVRGPLSGGEYRVAGNISSQFISGLLFALPLLDKDSLLHITPPIESRSYIGLTREAMAAFGVHTEWRDENTLFIPGRQKYEAREVTVEGDYSGAAFMAALAALGDDVCVTGLRADSLQGDRVYEKFFPMLSQGLPTIHIGNCPDLGPILFALAACRNGGIFTGTARLRLKESDRCEAMATELRKLGVGVTVEEDSVVIYPAAFHAPTEPLYGHNDHRIVMALSILLTRTGGSIEGAEAVAKSYPDFFEALASLGISLQKEESKH